MTSSILRLSLCALVMAALAGCGGSSNNGSSGGGGGSPTTVTYTFNGSAYSVPPAVVATQIGSGPYTLATLASGKLTLTIPSGETNFSVAYLCPPTATIPPENLEYINQNSIEDGTSFSGSCFSDGAPQTGVATVQVNAAAIPGAAGVAVDSNPLPWSSSPLDFSVTIPVGTYDIPVTVSKTEFYDSFDNYLAVKILRSQTVPGALNGGATIVFSAAVEVVPQTIAYNNVPAGFSPDSPLVLYETAGGGGILLDLEGPPSQYLAMPAAAYQAGDYYLFNTVASSATRSQSVGAETFASTGAPLSITFPAPWSYAGPTAAPLPTFNLDYAGFSGMSDVSSYATLAWSEGTTSFNQLSINATANYLSGSTSLTVPDLSGLAGFLPPPASGTLVDWNAQIFQSAVTGTNPPSGTDQFVQDNGTYTEP